MFGPVIGGRQCPRRRNIRITAKCSTGVCTAATASKDSFASWPSLDTHGCIAASEHGYMTVKDTQTLEHIGHL
jgi:hypothetical protein